MRVTVVVLDSTGAFAPLVYIYHDYVGWHTTVRTSVCVQSSIQNAYYFYNKITISYTLESTQCIYCTVFHDLNGILQRRICDSCLIKSHHIKSIVSQSYCNTQHDVAFGVQFTASVSTIKLSPNSPESFSTLRK